MNQDEQMVRLEKLLRRFLKTPIRVSREPRITAAKLGAYVKALKDRDNAKDALASRPDDCEAQAILRKTEQTLHGIRDTLTH